LDRNEGDAALRELGPELIQLIGDKSEGAAFPVVINYYMQRDEFRKAHEMLIAENFAYPGTPMTYLNLARFCAKFDNLMAQADENYRMAYLFSGKDPEIEREMNAFVAQNHRQRAQVETQSR